MCVCRLGNLSCLAEPSELLRYRNTEVFPVIQGLIATCAQLRLYLPSHMVRGRERQRKRESERERERLCKIVLSMNFLLSMQILQIVFILNQTDLRSPGSIPRRKLFELVPFLPWLGVDFLQELSQSQLLPDFSELATVSFTPTQVWYSQLRFTLKGFIKQMYG